MRKRVYKTGSENDESMTGWQTIYCSLSLIIVVFFVMLVSYSVADRKKMVHLKGTLTGKPSPVEETKGVAKSSGKPDREAINDGMWISGFMLALNRQVAMNGMERDVAVERFGGGVKVKFNSDIVFPPGSASINRTTYPLFDEMARVAKEKNLALAVQGHTDDIPIHSVEYPSNWELSGARAVNVVRYLIKEHDFPADRLTAEGFAQYRPLDSNGTPEGRRKNRRIEIFLGQ